MTKKTKGTVWVLTSDYNDYNQHGEYFVKVFKDKPTLSGIAEVLGGEGYLPGSNMGEAIVRCEHVLAGGGRLNTEDCWYNLEEVELA